MKRTLPLILACVVIPLFSGCMTSAVLHEARWGDRAYEVKDPNTGSTVTRPAYPRANYLLPPITIPADIATSPIQGLVILFLRPVHFGIVIDRSSQLCSY